MSTQPDFLVTSGASYTHPPTHTHWMASSLPSPTARAGTPEYKPSHRGRGQSPRHRAAFGLFLHSPVHPHEQNLRASGGCWNKVPRIWWLKTREVYSPTVLDNWETKVSRARTPPRLRDTEPVPVRAPVGSQSFLADRHITPVSAFVST